MNKKEYFDFLKKHLPKDKYKQRFLEELEEHFEDALYAKTIRKPTPEELVLEQMGNPNETLLYYKKLMSKSSKLYPLFESFFWGVLSAPLYLLLFLGSSFTEGTEVLLYKALIWVLIAGILAAIFYVFYRVVFSQLKPLNQLLSQREKVLSIVLNLAPAWVGSGLFILTFYFTDANERQDYFFPLVIFAFAAVVAFSAWKAFLHSFERKAWTTSSTFLNLLLFLVIAVLLIFTDVLGAFLFFTKVFWMIIFWGNIKLAVWASGFALVTLAIFCVYSITRWYRTKKQDFPFVKSAFVLLVLWAILIPLEKSPNLNPENLEWAKPQVELAAYLEGKEFGPFYTWSKKFRYDDGPGIYYNVQGRSDGYFIQMSGIANYTLKVNSLENLSWERSDMKWNEEPVPSNTVMHEDLNCVLSSMAAENYTGEEAPVLGGETDCKELYFKDELIFTRQDSGWLMLGNAVVSVDEQWLLLEFQNTVEGPILIHLVQLTD